MRHPDDPHAHAPDDAPAGEGPLAGVRVLDLSRILAGPTCTQLLGDLGADVVKIERPRQGDDTRTWGPPYLEGEEGPLAGESAYYLCANRNKRSVCIDLADTRGQALVRRLAARADVVVENFKVGSLARLGLAYEQLAPAHPGLVWCSITGFGQDGPRAQETGYDFLAQAMGGIMSLTGAPDGPPMKVGVGVADVVCGLYASTAILAALHERARSGRGQRIDLALFDTQLAWLVNAALNYLTGGQRPRRLGNAHPNIVPYQAFACADGWVVVAVGNDAQFGRLCRVAGLDALADDARFATNPARLEHRDALVAALERAFLARPAAAWIDALTAAQVPCGPVNEVPEALDDPQARHRGMRLSMPHPTSRTGEVALLGNPIHLSRTPVTYRRPPPPLGHDTTSTLRELLDLDDAAIAALRADGVV